MVPPHPTWRWNRLKWMIKTDDRVCFEILFNLTISHSVNLMLEVANNSALWHLANRENVANSQLSFLAAVHELASVHSLRSNKQLLLQAMLVNIPELHNGKRCATARIVNDLLNDTLDVTIALREIQSTQTSSAFPVLRMGLENRPTTPTTSTNDTALIEKCT